MNALTLGRSYHYYVLWANMEDQPDLNKCESTVSIWTPYFLHLPPLPISSLSQYFQKFRTSLWLAEGTSPEAHDQLDKSN